MIIQSIINHKGGVGKTTTTLNLGKALSMEGFRVLIIDFDPQANLSQSVGIEDPEKSVYHTLNNGEPLPVIPLSESLFIVPSDLELATAESKLQAQQLQGYLALKESLDPLKGDYDYILIDCPPSLGILTNNALMASTDVMIVLSSQYLPTKGMGNIIAAVEFAKKFNPALKISGILITLIENTIMSNSIIDWVKSSYKGLVYNTMIRKNVAVVESNSQGEDLFTYDPRCAAAQDYRLLSKEIIGKLVSHGS